MTTYNRAEAQLEQLPLELLLLPSSLDDLVGVDPGECSVPLCLIQNLGFSRVLWHDDEQKQAEDYSDNAFNEENLVVQQSDNIHFLWNTGSTFRQLLTDPKSGSLRTAAAMKPPTEQPLVQRLRQHGKSLVPT